MADSRIRRIPTAMDVSAPPSLRPSGVNPAIDVSGPGEGGQALAAGLSDLATGIGNAGAKIRARERATDVAAADARWLTGSLDIGQRFQNDGAYETFDKRVKSDTTTLRDEAAKLIRDPEARQAWLQEVELKRISLVAAVNERATTLSHDASRAKLETTVDDLAKAYSDPTTPQVVRDQARKSIAASIDVALGSGLLSPSEAEKLRQKGIAGADETLALNRARLGLLNDPQSVLTGLAIPSAADTAGNGIVTAATTVNGGNLPELDFSLARMTADLLGDANFPTDPKQARAYLSDPAMAQKYTAAAAAMLNDRYKGDLSAVAVALDPQGGTVLADRWVKSGHDESALPPAVAKRTRATMQAYRPAVSGERIPIVAGPEVDLANTDPNVVGRFEQLQSLFGEAVPLISGHRTAEHNAAVGGADKSQHLDGRALDLDVSKLSPERRAELIKMASAMGFTGIGVYANSMHLDTGPLRAWGPDYHSGSVPAWAKDAIAAHLSGKVSDVPVAYAGVAPQYQALTFDQRVQLAGEARQALKEKNVGMQASIETIAGNAPAAIANTGKYDGSLPDATAFVQAYGAVDGLQKFHQFEASMDTARTVFGFRAASADEIMAQVAAAAPTSSGNGAELETQRFDKISAAADQVLKARAADPAGYVMSVFPAVADDFAAAKDDPAKFAAALSKMATAQDLLGIDEPQLLPKSMATQAAAQFNDASLPSADRVGSIASLVLRTSDPKQQKAIYDQLLKAGLPEYTQGAVAAMVRGDTAGAQALMRAALVDPEKLAGALPVKGADIDAAIQGRMFGEGDIGDIVYGLMDGSPDSLARLRADSTLINRDVRLHLVDGSAGGDVNKAIDLTIKDMYGDVQPVTGGGVKITLPASEDAGPIRAGFAALRPQVADALKADMRKGLAGAFGNGVDPRSEGMSEIINMGTENAVDQVMLEGYFINAGDDQYQFFNPYTGAVIGNDQGEPLVFSKSDVLAAGANSPAAAPRKFPGMGGR